LHSDCQCKIHFAHGYVSLTAEKESLQSFSILYKNFLSDPIFLPYAARAALMQLAVIIANFLDGASHRQLMGQYNLAMLEVDAILQAYFQHSQVSRHVFF
jgi:hypothetical protein